LVELETEEKNLALVTVLVFEKTHWKLQQTAVAGGTCLECLKPVEGT
jgi:hypothetical protein